MDSRYLNSDIFLRRDKEWNDITIKNYITQCFNKIEIIPGWTFGSCDWVKNTKLKRTEELKKNVLETIRVILKNNTDEDVIYDLNIPKLVENQFFYIGGYFKTPIFQLFDYPIIYRNDIIRIRTNVISASLDLKKTDKNYMMNIFGKNIPYPLLLTAVHTEDELIQFLSQYTEENFVIQSIIEKCTQLWNNTTQAERISSLGSYFMDNINRVKKGTGAIFSIKTAYIVDFFSKPYFTTDSILYEFLHAIYQGKRSDTDLEKKRVRFAEYILAPLVKKIYDMLITLNSSTKNRYQISQNIVLDNCNVSSIVNFNLTINPITEIAAMLQLSLTGPGGFKKDNVPAHLRNLDDSQKGRICPADTPDREGCGIILNMVPTIKIDDSGNFMEPDPNVITSYPISLTPFLEHNDPTRLQMASSQSKQAITLKNGEQPLIRSGLEDRYLEQSTFLKIAKKNGTVVYKTYDILLVLYEDKEVELIRIGYRDLYLNIVDYIHTNLNMDDEFKVGDTICHSMIIKNKELALGKNLLTGILTYKGYNYEDGIIISQTTADNAFTSLHSLDLSFMIDNNQVLLNLGQDIEIYEAIPKVGQKLKRNEVYAKIKILDGEDGVINLETIDLTASVDCTVTHVEIYPNSWYKKSDEFVNFINLKRLEQTYRYATLYETLRKNLNKSSVDDFLLKNSLPLGITQLDCEHKSGKYILKSEHYEGIFFKIKAVYEEKISVGDKLANRHGNKGIISKIVADDMMPRLDDGRTLDIIINPLGIISRMNSGQLFELHLGECLHKLKLKMLEIPETKDKLKYLKGFLDIIDKTEDKWITNKILNDFGTEHGRYLIQPPFLSVQTPDVQKALEYCEGSFKQRVFDPTTNVFISDNIAIGYNYFIKLVHRAIDKMSARSIGPYSRKTLQPLGGKSRQGGHKLGEMEVWALQGHDANKLLRDNLTILSDSPGLKNEFLASTLNNPELAISDASDRRPQSSRLLDVNFNVLGTQLEFEEKEEEDTTNEVN